MSTPSLPLADDPDVAALRGTLHRLSDALSQVGVAAERRTAAGSGAPAGNGVRARPALDGLLASLHPTQASLLAVVQQAQELRAAGQAVLGGLQEHLEGALSGLEAADGRLAAGSEAAAGIRQAVAGLDAGDLALPAGLTSAGDEVAQALDPARHALAQAVADMQGARGQLEATDAAQALGMLTQGWSATLESTLSATIHGAQAPFDGLQRTAQASAQAFLAHVGGALADAHQALGPDVAASLEAHLLTRPQAAFAEALEHLGHLGAALEPAVALRQDVEATVGSLTSTLAAVQERMAALTQWLESAQGMGREAEAGVRAAAESSAGLLASAPGRLATTRGVAQRTAEDLRTALEGLGRLGAELPRALAALRERMHAEATAWAQRLGAGAAQLTSVGEAAGAGFGRLSEQARSARAGVEGAWGAAGNAFQTLAGGAASAQQAVGAAQAGLTQRLRDVGEALDVRLGPGLATVEQAFSSALGTLTAARLPAVVGGAADAVGRAATQLGSLGAELGQRFVGEVQGLLDDAQRVIVDTLQTALERELREGLEAALRAVLEQVAEHIATALAGTSLTGALSPILPELILARKALEVLGPLLKVYGTLRKAAEDVINGVAKFIPGSGLVRGALNAAGEFVSDVGDALDPRDW